MLDRIKELLQNRKATYVEKTPNDVYREVAHEFEQFSPEDIAAIGGIESQHGKYNKPIQGGSATGLFQIQPKTAEEVLPGSSESLNDYNIQSDIMKALLRKNNPKDLEEAYLQHNLGKSGAKKILNAEDHKSSDEVISSAARKGNKGLYDGKSVGEVRKLIKDRLTKATDGAKLRPSILDLFKE